VGVRIVTDKALDNWLARHQEILAAQLADAKALPARIAEAIEALLPEDCPHRDRPSCAKCSQRRTVQAAAAVVRETGGVK
jgi:hypothetical protein